MRKTMAISEPIVLGKVGENEVNKVLFPVRGWKELYGDGEFGLVALLPGENDPYPVPISEYTLNGEFVEWVIKSSDVAYDGRGKVELRYSVAIPDTTPVEYKRVKSVVYDTIIWDALGTNSLEPPEPWQPWIDDVEDKAVRAEDAAEYAEAAQGLAEDARDAAEDARDDARAAAEDAENAVNTAFGQITATATTLSPGTSATASFDPSTKVMSFGIPRGADGSGDGIWGQQNNQGAYLPTDLPGGTTLSKATILIGGFAFPLSMIEDKGSGAGYANLALFPPMKNITVESAAAGSTTYTTTSSTWADIYGGDASYLSELKYCDGNQTGNIPTAYPTSVTVNDDDTITLTFAESLNPNTATTRLTLGITLDTSSRGVIAVGNGIYSNGSSSVLAGTAVGNSGQNVLAVGQNVQNSGNSSIVAGIRNRNAGVRSIVAGSRSLNTQTDAAVFGRGHNTTGTNPGIAVMGNYSDLDSDTLFAVGNGADDDNRSNAMEVTKTGEILEGGTKLSNKYEAKGKATVSGNEYSITRKPLAITENGVTTTYYVADIT